MINANKKIEDADDFNGYASELFHDYLATFTRQNGLIRDVEEDDGVDEGIDFIYTQKGHRLAEKMKSKLCKIGNRHFPNDDIEIETNLYIES